MSLAPEASQAPSTHILTVNGVDYSPTKEFQTIQQPDGSSFIFDRQRIRYKGRTYYFGSIPFKKTLVSGPDGVVEVKPVATSSISTGEVPRIDTKVLPRASSNASNTTSEATQEYFFFFKDGTPNSTVQDYIAQIPNQGRSIPMPAGPIAYVANLTEAQAEGRQNDAIVEIFGLNTPREFWMANVKRADTPTANQNIWRRDPATFGQVLYSRDGTNEMSEDWYASYLYHPSLGQGTTIYLLDTGMNKEHEEFQNRPGGATTTGWCVPNWLSGGDQPDDDNDEFFALDDYADFSHDEYLYFGHGNNVASTAVGKNLGVASKANLVMVKITNGKSSGKPAPDPPVETLNVTPAMLKYMLLKVLGDITSKNLQRKAVVSCSIGWMFYPNHKSGTDPVADVWEWFLNEAKALDIVVLESMGNGGNQWSHALGADAFPYQTWTYPDGSVSAGQIWHREYEVPGRLGNRPNDFPNLFTVGGVNPNGSLFIPTTPVRTGPQMEPITVYGLASEVRSATNYGIDTTTMVEGCSYATPAVAGLIAYWLGLPDDLTNLASSQNFFQDIKQKLQQLAWQRVTQDKLITFPMDQLNYAPWFPNKVAAAYNGVWADFCNNGRGPPPKVKRNPQVEMDQGLPNMTTSLPLLVATEVPVVSNGTVEPGFGGFFNLSCPLPPANSNNPSTLSTSIISSSASSGGPLPSCPSDLIPGVFNGAPLTTTCMPLPSTIVSISTAGAFPSCPSNLYPGVFGGGQATTACIPLPSSQSSMSPSTTASASTSSSPDGAPLPSCPPGEMPNVVDNGLSQTTACDPMVTPMLTLASTTL